MLPGRADVREHLTCRVVDHQRRAVAHVAPVETAELTRKHVARAALDGRGQGGHYALARLPQQLSRELRRERRRGQQRLRPRERVARQRRELVAADFRGPPCSEGAGAGRGAPGRGVRCGDQACEQPGLGVGEPGRRLAIDRPRRRGDALQLAAYADAVEIRLEDLRLGPAVLDAPGGSHLRPLGAEPATTGGVRAFGFDQPRELHCDRARAAAPAAAQHLPCGGGERAPVDAAVLVEALVLDADDCGLQRWRDVFECDPVAAEAVEVEPVGFEHDTVAVEEHTVGRAPLLAHAIERRRGRRRVGDRRERERQRSDCEQSGHRSHRATRTSNASFGSSPNISGAYIASTRVVGSTKLPALLSRSVYSTRNDPFGT